jgi:polysaccharide export outer membrane protein
MRYLAFSAALAVTVLGGCATGGHGGALGETGQVQVLTAQALPVPAGGEAISSRRDYVIGPQDTLIIDVFGIPELMNREIAVDSAGRISFPIAGSIEAAGLTPAQLAEEMTVRLQRGYVKHPQVSVNVKEEVSHLVTVDGQVSKPGVYPIMGDMTLMRAVATAQGASEYAKLDDVVIMRTVNGQRYAGLYNLAAIRRGNYPDPKVYGNDVVIVGDSPQRRLFDNILKIAPVLTTPLIIALQNNGG